MIPGHMPIDFERDFGVNAGYAEALFAEWQQDPSRVDAAWRVLFEDAAGDAEAAPAPAAVEPAAEAAEPAAVEAEADAGAVDDASIEPLIGMDRRIAQNMEASLALPVATSVRTLSAKVLLENRAILNEHMQVRAYPKTSFTHLVAFALARALREMPRMAACFEERDGRGVRRIPRGVSLGIAIDVPGPDGSSSRALVVPSIKNADALGFTAFLDAFEDIVARGRTGALTAADFAGTNVTLTNPGGFGTGMSVPRLMPGQGLIVATGAIGVPPELAGAGPGTLARLALGPVMTITATYDHRVIQGAESGLFLQRVEELLQGEDGFYEDVFRAMRVPWRPLTLERDADAAKAEDRAKKQTQVWSLINAYRVRGCRVADLDPLEYKPDPLPSLDPGSYGLTVWDLDRRFLCAEMLGKSEMPLREILAVLRKSYCRRWSIEYMHIVERKRKHWLRDRVENPRFFREFTRAERFDVLKRLYRAENFERYLHAQYVGNKRFSLEGADSLIPALAEIVERAAEGGVERVVIGMAHRGRLNVLANILAKSYEQIFREFEGVLLPLSREGSGDVKYHLGQRGTFKTRTGQEVEIILSPNPSHLEAVDPVVCGMVRALQDASGDGERKRTLAVLIHGDAAFSGQGVVAETLNMSELRAYSNGGTVHVVVNNQIGFTAGPRDLRSTHYCTDIGKSIEAPILHANGDYPESVLRAVQVAVDYQREFGRDAVVDMVCYRRWGHNEGDEPAFTQPLLYAKIRAHPTVVDAYTSLLERRGDLTKEELDEIAARFAAELEGARTATKGAVDAPLSIDETVDLDDDDPADYVRAPSPETGVAGERLVALIDRLNKIPDGLVVHPNLLRQLRRREDMVRGEVGVDWGCAEALAFGTLLAEGVPVRLTGQDSGRGTFSHRHAVIRDQATDAEHVPLAGVAADGAEFFVYDSLLSEEAVLAFEYGYSISRPAALVLWEAQFGDFVNGAQIPIDQFVLAGEAKWHELAGVTLLLPHGYDGQGPEHSSAHVERFLAGCSGGNVTVANCSTSAQYFHLIRRQGLAQPKRPLIVFTPKSLLRDKQSASPASALASGRFAELIDDPEVTADAERVVLCSGKVYYDLFQHRADSPARGATALVRLEQLYPFPREAVRAVLARHPRAKPVWCQEEPRNMGPWPSLLQRFADLDVAIAYAGRAESASPATGSYRRHQAEQGHLVERAFRA
jgi:2-oxoglutarate dehydrogenase E1 component